MTPTEASHYDKLNAICVAIDQVGITNKDVVSLLIQMEHSVKKVDPELAKRIADFWIAEHIRNPI